MNTILTELNNWGKGTFFKYGFIETLCFILIFIILAWIIRKLTTRYIKRNVKVNTIVVLRVVKIIIYVITIYACLSLLEPFENVLSKLWGSAGILAVVLGLTAQEAMGNIVNGLLISTFKPFTIGDLIKVNKGEYEGYVIDISLRDTTILTYENTKVIVPNSTMNKAVLENVTQTHNTKGNFLDLNISYESDIDKASQIMIEEALKHPNYIDNRTEEEIQQNKPPLVVRLTKFNDSSMTLRVTIQSSDSSTGYVMLCDLRASIKKRFDAEGIVLAYPHCDVTIMNNK